MITTLRQESAAIHKVFVVSHRLNTLAAWSISASPHTPLEKPMRTLLAITFLAAATTVLAKEDKKPSLDGTYVIIGLEKGGEKAPDEFFKKQPEEERTIVIKGNKLIPTKKKGMEPLDFTIDASKKPAEITATETKADKKETSYGIYKLEGDILTICLVENGQPSDRPKEFKTTKDSKAALVILKKKKDQ